MATRRIRFGRRVTRRQGGVVVGSPRHSLARLHTQDHGDPGSDANHGAPCATVGSNVDCWTELLCSDTVAKRYRPTRREAAESIGCLVLLLWPVVSAVVVLALFIWSPSGSLVWVLALVILAVLLIPQLVWADTLWDAADRQASRLERDEPNFFMRNVQGIVIDEEGFRATVLPLLIGAGVAAFPGQNPTLAAGFLIAALVVFVMGLMLPSGAPIPEGSDPAPPTNVRPRRRRKTRPKS